MLPLPLTFIPYCGKGLCLECVRISDPTQTYWVRIYYLVRSICTQKFSHLVLTTISQIGLLMLLLG